MTKLQWAAVGVALGVGVLAQIPGHDDSEMEGHSHDMATMTPAEHTSGLSTVTLAVSGMT